MFSIFETVRKISDRELNAWCSLRKTCQYRSELEEKKDVVVFKNKGKNVDLKRKVLPSIFAADQV
jgi:protein KRI1